MNNITKMKIEKPKDDIFEAFVDPDNIGNFWFSSSSERWEQGKTVTLTYEEYNAQGDIYIKEIEENNKIVFHWGTNGERHTVSITLNESTANSTVVEVVEEGFNKDAEGFLHQLVDNKEGWVYTLTCLKAYLESNVKTLRASLVK